MRLARNLNENKDLQLGKLMTPHAAASHLTTRTPNLSGT